MRAEPPGCLDSVEAKPARRIGETGGNNCADRRGPLSPVKRRDARAIVARHSKGRPHGPPAQLLKCCKNRSTVVAVGMPFQPIIARAAAPQGQPHIGRAKIGKQPLRCSGMVPQPAWP